MKKANNVYGMLGILALLIGAGAGFGFFAAPAVYAGTAANYATSYDFIFGNLAFGALESSGTFVASFVLLVIASAFQLLAILFSFGRSHRFAGFLHLLAGIMAAVTAVITFLTPSLAPSVIPGTAYTMMWGVIAAGGVIAVSALLSLVIGAVGLFGKKKN